MHAVPRQPDERSPGPTAPGGIASPILSLPAPEHLQGSSLVPLFESPGQAWKSAVFSRIWDASTVRTNDYRLTHYAEGSPQGDERHLPNPGQFELFDLHADPRENVNIARSHPEIVARLNRLLQSGWQAALPPNGHP